MSHDIVLYVSEENNCRLVYRYDIESGCVNLKEQLLVLDQYDNKCAGLWFNTTDYETPFNSAVKELVAAVPNSHDYNKKLKKLFLVMLDSGYSSMEMAARLSPLLLKNPDLALHTNSILQKKLNEIENNECKSKSLYNQYNAEDVKPCRSFESFIDSLLAIIKNLLMVSKAGLTKDSSTNNSKDIYKLLSSNSDQRLFSKLNRDYMIEHRNDSPENRREFDNNLGLVVYSK